MLKRYIKYRFSEKNFGATKIIVYIVIITVAIMPALQKSNIAIITKFEWSSYLHGMHSTMLQYILYLLLIPIYIAIDICKSSDFIAFYWLNYIQILIVDITVVGLCDTNEATIICKAIIICTSIVDIYCLANKGDEIHKLYQDIDE